MNCRVITAQHRTITTPSSSSSKRGLLSSSTAASSHVLTAASKVASRRSSWLSLHQSSVSPLPAETQPALADVKQAAYNWLDTKSFSWLPLHQGSVSPLPAEIPQPQEEVKQTAYSELETSSLLAKPAASRGVLRPRASLLLGSGTPPEGPRPQRGLQSTASSGVPRTKSNLRSKSSLTAASVFDVGASLGSSDDDNSLEVPEALIDSAMFLLRDHTLANPQAEVGSRQPGCTCMVCKVDVQQSLSVHLNPACL